MEEKNLQQAQKTFATLLSTMERRGWTCDINQEDLMIEFSVTGDDLTMPFRIMVDPGSQLVILYSGVPFNLPEEAIAEGALVLCIINDHLPDGSFDLDITTGRIAFRLTATFRESILSMDAFDYMLQCASTLVDDYNDKLLLLSKGKLDWQDFAKEFDM